MRRDDCVPECFMSSSLSITNLTGLISLLAATATAALSTQLLVSLPPNPPPSLLALQLILFACMPRALEIKVCVVVRAWVDAIISIPPSSPKINVIKIRF